MAIDNPGNNAKSARTDRLIADAVRHRQTREAGYREQALKIYPWICGRCSREFTHQNLRELTVHHRDHNHDNNPSDGSNWELLCLYCHDNEHSRQLDAEAARQAGINSSGSANRPLATAQPFANLKDLLKGRQQ
ncbi:MAG TPA: YajD family HNH nuclease [Accumulibacter sp.]|uniref:YajD family HNH nuclease n=1 Tax=Accumulibacter sp. TaxID=2053492 RepID=UPI000EEFA429|nr:YajD family HNH nuclease [Accumulibacter sp.]HCZ15171.1 HNH nuclease family protein [Accumulibacter sp.]HRD91788.1 YajD family HNH nuclease [Accumulibacter sp.]HRF73483.1 YajD family HNH nuclease [Accumulibacter sp.]